MGYSWENAEEALQNEMSIKAHILSVQRGVSIFVLVRSFIRVNGRPYFSNIPQRSICIFK